MAIDCTPRLGKIDRTIRLHYNSWIDCFSSSFKLIVIGCILCQLTVLGRFKFSIVLDKSAINVAGALTRSGMKLSRSIGETADFGACICCSMQSLWRYHMLQLADRRQKERMSVRVFFLRRYLKLASRWMRNELCAPLDWTKRWQNCFCISKPAAYRRLLQLQGGQLIDPV